MLEKDVVLTALHTHFYWRASISKYKYMNKVGNDNFIIEKRIVAV